MRVRLNVKKIFFAISLLISGFSFGQVPANDNCATAQNLGTLPTPAACPSGVGAAVNVSGTNINATAPNPYTTLLGCQTGGNQPGPALDVWYRFVASGNQVNINITPGAAPVLANPAITLWTGTCGNLVGYNCDNNGTAGGNNTVLFQPTTPGTTYYIQISGMTATAAGNFNMSVNASNDCNNCLQNANLVITPTPTNGTYPPNTTVKFCYNITSYAQVSSNWLHGVIPTFGNGWNLASLTTTAAAALTPATGTWSWFPGGNTSTATGSVTGPGFYFDYNTTPGNAGNNFGDYCATTPTCSWSFCWTIKTKPDCSTGTNLNISINTTGDGETGSWSSVACTGDPNYNFAAVMSCCTASAASTSVTCYGGTNGSATVTPTGSAPFTYTWTSSPVQNTSTATALPAGTYTATIRDNNACIATATVLVTQPTSVTATMSFTNATCTTLGAASVLAGGGTPGYTYTWSPSGGNAATASNLSPGNYTVTVADSKGCLRTATVAIAQTGTVSAAFSTPTPTQCLTGNSYVFTAGTLTGTHTYSFNPTAGAPATGNVATYGPVSFTAPGTYTVTHTITSGVCTNTVTSLVVINPMPTVTANNNSPACVGGSVAFTGTGGGTYSWSGPSGFTSALQNPTITPITLANAGLYTLTVTLNGCTGTATTNVSISNPTTSAANTGPYCAGATIQLNAPAATSYTWTGPGGFTSNLQNPTIPASTTANAGVYTVSVSLGVCSASASTNVVVNALPTPTASNTGPYCPGNTIQLNVGAFTTYTWSGPGGFTSNAQNPTVASASVANSGTYTVTVSNASGCINTSTTNVLVNPTPTVTANNNSPSCVGGSVIFTGTGGGTYSWSGPSGFTSALQNPTLTPITLANAGVYTVTVTLNGCVNTATTSVSISNPTTSASNTGPYCVGSTIQLNAPVANSYTWTGPGGFTSNLQNPTIPSSTTANAGVYTVSVSLGVCSASASTNVVVNALPTPTASNTGPYCPGNTIQLNVGAFTTYTWSGPSSFSSNSQNPTQTNAQTTNSGVYTVSVTNASGCVNSSTTNVVVNPSPVVVIGSNSPVCLNGSINLNAGGGTSYSWSGPNGFTSVLQNPTIASATSVNAGVYTVTVTALGCISTGTVNVTVLTPTTTAGNTGPFCVGTTIQLNTPAGTSYTWSGPGGFTSNLQNPTIPGATTAMAGTYSVIVSAGSCTANATTNVVINTLPTPIAGNTGPYCPGNTINLSVGAFSTYTWSGPSSFSSNSQNPTQTNAQTTNSGTYTVAVTDANGCVNTSTTNVVVNPSPVVNIGSNSPVCISTPINLTSGGGTSYSWSGPNGFTSALQNPSIASATALDAGVYTVTVTSLGCTNTGTISVSVLSPTTTASNTGAYCAGATIQLNTPAANTYSWTGPGGFTSNLQNPAILSSNTGMSGIYNVTVSVGSCTAAATTTVTVNALPTPNATNTGPYCPGNTIQLNVGAYSTYTWTGPSSFNSSVQNPTQGSITTSNGGNYIVAVTDANGCVNTSTTTVVVNPTPVVNIGSNSPVCISTPINLTSGGGTTYSWSGPNSFTSANQNPSIASATSLDAGVYTVTVTALGCNNTGTVNVSVLNPTTTASNTGPYCAGATIQLNTPIATSYTWNGPGGYVSNVQNPTITNSNASMTGSYDVTVTVGTCTASASTPVTVNALPTPTATNTGPYCTGSTIQLNVGAFNTYTWTGPQSFNDNNQNPSITSAAVNQGGVYVVTVTDGNGCVNTSSTTVIVNATPVAAASGATVCENFNANLSASGGASYSWSGPGGFTSASQNPVIAAAPLSAAGQYTVIVSAAGSCSSTAVANVVVNPAPTANVVSNSPICVNNILTLSATGGTAFAWTGPNGFVSSSQSPTVNANTVAYSGNYQVTVTDASGCSGTAMYNATVNPNPVASISSGPNVGCAPLCVQFTVNSTPAASIANWNLGNGVVSNGSLTAQTCYNAQGVYTISSVVVDQNGCTGSATYTVQVYPQPVADFNHAPIKPIINQDPFVTFTDASYGTPIVSWNWYFMSTAQYTSNQQNPTFMYTEPGSYAVTLIVKSDKGCLDTLTRPLIVGEDFGIYVPNAFTPNEDGLNDIFQPKGFGIVKYELQIFDRWGERVFSTKEMTEGWDGKYQGRGGEICEQATYTWLINVTSVFGKAHELKGHVTLIK